VVVSVTVVCFVMLEVIGLDGAALLLILLFILLLFLVRWVSTSQRDVNLIKEFTYPTLLTA